METNKLKLKLFKMTILNFEYFMKTYNLKNDTINESELQRVQKLPINPRDSKRHSDKGFVNIDSGSQGGTHWTCFIVEDNKSYYFDSFVSQLDSFLLNQLLKPIIYHNYKIEDIISKLCGSYCF